jgi:hypothetical protein
VTEQRLFEPDPEPEPELDLTGLPPAVDPLERSATGYERGGRTERGRARLARGSCRSCHAPVLWVTFASGGRNPLDLEPDPVYGDIMVVEREHTDRRIWRIALKLTNEDLRREAIELGIPLRRSHFATCPDADEHRREQTRNARRDLA